MVDFAYSVHTQLGNEMTVALVNGRLVPPSYVLSHGEVVEIKREAKVTCNTIKRHEQWLGLIRTRSAKMKIKQFIREHAHLVQKKTGGACADKQLLDDGEWLGRIHSNGVSLHVLTSNITYHTVNPLFWSVSHATPHLRLR